MKSRKSSLPARVFLAAAGFVSLITQAIIVCIVLLLLAGGCQAEVHVREIHIRSKDVFDPSHPEFDTWPFHFANHFHVKTRDSVLLRELLLKPGDPYDPELLQESERNLRRYRFLTDVTIEKVQVGENEYDLYVNTEDQWTLDVTASLGTFRGNRTFDIGLDEDNFLGLGKHAALKYERNEERNIFGGLYSDPRLFGTWLRLIAQAQNSSDGHRFIVSLGQPFYSQDAEWAYGIDWSELKRDQHLYFETVDSAIQANHQQNAGLFLSRAFGSRYNHLRTGVFVAYAENIFTNARILDPAAASHPIVQQNLNPPDRRFIAFGISLDQDHRRYIERHYVDNFGRTEDLPVGRIAGASIARARNQEGRDYWNGGVYARYAFSTPASYLQLNAAGGIQAQQGNWNNGIVHADARFYHTRGPASFGLFESPRQTFAAALSSIFTRSVDAPFQIALDENEGIRGFSFKSFTGLNRVVLNLEHRIYTTWDNELIGSAVVPFVDAGIVWGEGERKMASSAGIGLRLGLKKYGHTQVLRIDFAYPLTHVRGNKFSVSITTGPVFTVL